MGLLCIFLIVSCLASVISSDNLPFQSRRVKCYSRKTG
uniref:BLTX616 n=1 Tax=Nephila pilipes TaxID=299642 RepID=A0A076L2V2_NEPPI|nr:BLTX616 [Nephila pilipes]